MRDNKVLEYNNFLVDIEKGEPVINVELENGSIMKFIKSPSEFKSTRIGQSHTTFNTLDKVLIVFSLVSTLLFIVTLVLNFPTMIKVFNHLMNTYLNALSNLI